jgi:hypothetical protein
MNTKTSLACLLTALCVIPPVAVFAQAADEIQVITEFTSPVDGATAIPEGINALGDIVGRLTGPSGIPVRGFLRFSDGRFAPPIIDPNESGTGYTDVRGINSSRHLCGFHLGSEAFDGFLATRGGFKEFNLPHAIWEELYGINDADDFCGAVSDDENGNHFFPFISSGGARAKFSVPGAISAFPYGINNLGDIVGLYEDDNEVEHGFFRDAAGTLTAPIDPPGSILTILYGLNDDDIIVGRFTDSAGLTRGFVLELPDTYLIFDQPDATLTSLNGINNNGAMCGRVIDAAGITHAIVAQLVE